MRDTEVIARVQRKFSALEPVLDERARRQWAGAEAESLGRGGVSAVAEATGLSRTTVAAGTREVRERARGEEDGAAARAREAGRVRRAGGGRKPLAGTDPTLARDLDRLVEPGTRGDPQSPLRWTCKSTRRLAAELRRAGHRVGHVTVAGMLRRDGYSLQSNRKTKEGGGHPDRDGQFRHIGDRVKGMQGRGQPVVSVDAKKKELVGEFRNGGREWRPKGQPEEVRVYDFVDKAPDKGRVTPYGVYDLAANEGWVSVGTDHDTARFAAETIHKWWREMGEARYPGATELLVCADGGGSNGSRNRLWKVALQGLADRTGLTVHVSHFPPGASKWNKVEHRLFCHVTQNWRGKPLVSHDVIVSLIGSTTTAGGLKVRAALDTAAYPTGVKVTKQEMDAVNLARDDFHGDWNYSISPRQQRRD
jgi:hypothetical protein